MSISEAHLVAQRLPESITAEIFKNALSTIKNITILKTVWYPEVLQGLAQSSLSFLKDNDIPDSKIRVLGVPGALELPLAAQYAFAKADIVIALGCVIRGDTPHFDFVCREAIAGLTRVSLDYQLPIGMGVLTVDSIDQAKARFEKGKEATQAALLMWALRKLLETAQNA